MYLSSKKFIENLIWLITAFMLSSFLVFDKYEWGKYSFFLCAVLIFSLNIIKRGFNLHIRITPFIVLFGIFVAYTTLTAFWSLSYSDTLTMSRTLLRILVCFSLVYWSYMDETDPEKLIYCMVFSSYFVGLYTIFFFGFSSIIHASDDILLEESFANINAIAVFIAIGVVCELYLVLYRGPRLYSLLSLMSIVIIAASQSRKAIVVTVLGVMALILFRFSTSKNLAYRILEIVFLLLLTLTAVYFIAKLPIFSSVNKRLDMMINSFLGQGKMDHSSLIRNDMRELGYEYWLQRPIRGFGFGATHIIAYRNLNVDTYLHNNYIELLASGGILGLISYYSMHIYLIAHYFKLRKTDERWFVIGIILIGLILISDYGKVSYYSKTGLFELMLLFIILENIANGRKEAEDAAQGEKLPVRS